jgi:hypothetical protein
MRRNLLELSARGTSLGNLAGSGQLIQRRTPDDPRNMQTGKRNPGTGKNQSGYCNRADNFPLYEKSFLYVKFLTQNVLPWQQMECPGNLMHK